MPSLQEADSSSQQPLENSIHPLDSTASSNTPGDEELDDRVVKPCWKKPAPRLMVLAPLNPIVSSATVLPKIFGLYPALACRIHHRQFHPPSLTGIDVHTFLSEQFLNPHLYLGLNVVTQRAPDLMDSDPCLSNDPDYRSAAFILFQVTSLSTAILAFLTIGWWGSFSDRHGRARTMGIMSIGQLISSFNILFVANYVEWIPGGYWFFLVDAVITGALGGSSIASVAAFAYLADVSDPGNRSRNFSVVSGLLLAGAYAGAKLGEIAIQSNNILSIFYFTAALNVLYACLVWFILPESLSTIQMERARHIPQTPDNHPTWVLWLRRIFFFLMPLSFLLPSNASSGNGPINARRKRNLTILVLAYGAMLLTTMISAYQFFYALDTFAKFGRGYYTSSTTVTDVLYLVLGIPLLMKLAHKRQRCTTSPAPSEVEPLLPGPDAANHDSMLRSASTRATRLDLTLAYFSIWVYIVTYALLPFASSGIVFTAIAAFGSLGFGLSPAIHSVALEMHSQKDGIMQSGKLFAALSLIGSISAAIGFALYTSIYQTTYATFSAAIFVVALGNALIAFALILFVRVSSERRTIISSLFLFLGFCGL